MEIGQIVVGSALGLNGTLSLTTLFVAQVPGLYLLSVFVQIVATDNAGTLAMQIQPFDGSTIEEAPNGQDPLLAIVTDANLTLANNGFCAAFPSKSETPNSSITVGVTAAGLTGTTYNVFLSAQRLL